MVYEWSIPDDAIRWGDNALDVLGLDASEQIATGRSFAALLDPANPTSRHDVVLNGTGTDDGRGVAYQVQYSLLPEGRGSTRRLWIEDIGRWYAGHDGRPVRASDVRFSHALYVDAAVGSPHARVFDGIDSVTVRDSLTAVVWWHRRNPEQFFQVAYNLAVMPEHVYGALPRASLREAAVALPEVEDQVELCGLRAGLHRGDGQPGQGERFRRGVLQLEHHLDQRRAPEAPALDGSWLTIRDTRSAFAGSTLQQGRTQISVPQTHPSEPGERVRGPADG